MSIEETSNQSPVIIDLSPATVVSTTNDDAVYDPLGDQATDTVQVVTPVKEEEKVKEEVKDLSLPKQNVVIDVNPIRDGKLKDQDSIALASDTYPALDQTLINTPSVQLEEKAEWLSNIQDGVDTEVYNGTGYERFAQPDGMFTNLLKTDQNVSLTGLYAASPKSSNNSLTGERAVLAVMNHMKVGNIYMSPLWNSGFWVSIKPPTESAVIDLMHLIRTEKVRLGRATYGLAHSSTTSVVGKYVIEFIKAHIYGTTINSKELNIDDIDRYVHMNDIDALILSIICTMYPSGFNFARSCVADPLLCNHVTEAILDPSKLLFVNRRAMTESMLGHMSNRRLNSTTLKDVESYQSQMASRNTRSMVYSADGSSINFELKTPNIRRYIESSDRWIADIETTADRLLQKDTNDNQRDNLIRDHAKATTMRQYSHYVDSISFGDNNVVQDFESICKVLSALSTDNILSSEFNKSVNNLINFSSIAATAIPTFACPSCKKPAASRSKEDPAYVNVIPLDMISIFFALVRVKMAKIAQR